MIRYQRRAIDDTWRPVLASLRAEAARRAGLDAYPGQRIREFEEDERTGLREARLVWQNTLARWDEAAS